jgi:hypothetical protein
MSTDHHTDRDEPEAASENEAPDGANWIAQDARIAPAPATASVG